MKIRYFAQIALSAWLAVAIASPATATGVAPASTSIQIAQASGECRQVRRLERIYSAASVASDRIADIPAGSNVTLAGEMNQPSAGWIRISSPAE